MLYESQDAYVEFAVPFLSEGLEVGEGAIVAHTRPGLAMMREALGSDAAHVTFVDVSSAYTRPARTLASYHRVYVEQLGKSPSLRAHWPPPACGPRQKLKTARSGSPCSSSASNQNPS